MKLPLTVVIAARNCVDRVEGTVRPWINIATEIIFVDQNSSDGTAELARKTGCTVIVNEPPGGNFDLNRKLGIQKANTPWILYIDTDERPTSEMLAELEDFFADPKKQSAFSGVKVPNYFYFLGKPLKHGIYNPRSAEIRMFKKDVWEYPCEQGYHRGISVKGKTTTMEYGYRHFNVNTLSEWFIKTNQYTEHDAVSSYKNSKDATWLAVFDAMRFFLRHYFFKRGFLDGFRGFVSVFYFMLYHMTLKIKVWEKKELDRLKIEEDYLIPIAPPKR